MTKTGEPLDLSGYNRLPGLLAERERQAAIIRKAKLAKDEIEAEIREKLGHAEEAFTERTIRRREFTVPAGSYQVLQARRLEPVGE
jgi:hypothetical protein